MHLQRCRGINNARLLLHSDPLPRHYSGHPSHRPSLLIPRHFFRATSIKPRGYPRRIRRNCRPRPAEGRRTENEKRGRALVPSEERAAPFLHVLASFLPKPSWPARKFGFAGELADCKLSRINGARSRRPARARIFALGAETWRSRWPESRRVVLPRRSPGSRIAIEESPRVMSRPLTLPLY